MSIYRIADLNIDIDHKYKYTPWICRDYIAEDQSFSDMSVCADSSEYEKDKKVVPTATDGYLESLSLYRAISNKLLDFNGFILHASVIEKDGNAFAFCAKSGTGKTTHSSLWLRKYPDARIINGDKPLLRIFDDNIFVYGTPWCGKENYNVNTRSPLKAICFIERSESNSIVRISKTEAVSRIFSQLLIPKNPEDTNKLLDLLSKVIDKVSVYLLKCNMDLEAAEVAYNGMKI